MATARIVHHFPDGATTEMEAALEVDYPDACREVVARVLDLWQACVNGEAEAETDEP